MSKKKTQKRLEKTQDLRLSLDTEPTTIKKKKSNNKSQQTLGKEKNLFSRVTTLGPGVLCSMKKSQSTHKKTGECGSFKGKNKSIEIVPEKDLVEDRLGKDVKILS